MTKEQILQKHFTAEFGHDGHGKFMQYILDAMEEYAKQQVKNLNIPAVVEQSGQLLAFAQYLHNHSYVNKGFKPETLVRRFKGE